MHHYNIRLVQRCSGVTKFKQDEHKASSGAFVKNNFSQCDDNRAIAPPKFSKIRLVVKYNIKFQSFCSPPKISAGCDPGNRNLFTAQQINDSQCVWRLKSSRCFV